LTERSSLGVAVRWARRHRPWFGRAEVHALLAGLSAEGFAIEVDGRGIITHWSKGAAGLYDLLADDVLGKPLRAVAPELDVLRGPALGGQDVVTRSVAHPRPDGSALPLEVVVSTIHHRRSPAGIWLVGRCPNREPLEPARDHVTGLASRSSFIAAVASAVHRGLTPGVLLVDVSGVDAVNQTIGHQAGDELLRVLAERIRSALAPGDLAARFFRRFAVLVEDGTGGDLEDLARDLTDALEATVDVGPEAVRVGVAVGISRARPGEDAAVLVRHADLALFAAQKSGSGCETYDPAAHRLVEARREREVDLRSAVSRGELVVHYQPVIDLRDNAVVGAEALVRWRRANGELVMPGDFIDIAETSGAILGIGLWVLEEACRQVREWNDLHRSRTPLEIAVNLSVRQLSSVALTADIAEVLGGVGIDPGRVTLEVTESSLMDDPERMIRRLDELRGMGLTLSMDDFGTGYSSLSYLRQLPIDVVKIDRSFVSGVARSDEEWSLAVAIVKLATSLGKRTLAEGVETAAQLAHLRALHCDLAQGFLFSRPLPAAEFEKLLQGGG
jgi:diguanylate cyclase (GGDEF)-like protein